MDAKPICEPEKGPFWSSVWYDCRVRRQGDEPRLVFISHSSRDTWVAKQVAREIEACGATPFLDEAEIDVGADFEEDIPGFLGRRHTNWSCC